MTIYNKPVPIPDIISQSYWDAAKRHELQIQRCKSCKEYIFYPRTVCPNCWSQDLEAVKAKGKGKVYSYTAVYQAGHPGFKNEVPYIFAVIKLDEGPHIMTNIIDCKPEDCKIDMPVEVVFADVTEDITLPKFRPVKK